ncbi:hypothetical protein [Pontiella desulfatans]|nr:hypothetical protein [Pontiella desulfatans]
MKKANPQGVRRMKSWSGQLDGNVNRFSARFINQVSLLDGNVKSESLFRTPIGTELDGNVNFFA